MSFAFSKTKSYKLHWDESLKMFIPKLFPLKENLSRSFENEKIVWAISLAIFQAALAIENC